MGRSYTGSIRAAGYAVPLPQGKWTVVADQTSKISSTHGAGSGRWLYLAKIVDHRLMGVVHVLALRRTTGTLASLNEASLPPATCEPTKPDDPGHWKCATVGYNYLGHWAQWSDQSAHLNSSERAAAGELTVKGIAIPQDFMAVRMWRSEEGGALFTEYMFNPEEAGIVSHSSPSAQESDWTNEKIAKSPEREAYSKKIATWGTAMYQTFKADFAASLPLGT